MKLKKKTVLVTGAAKRIGRAIALTLAQNGANIAVHYNYTADSDVERLLTEIRSFNVNCWKFKADFSKKSQAASLIRRVNARAGKIDFLINNASIFKAVEPQKADEGTLSEALRVNAIAPFILSQHFKTQAQKGAIINILDAGLKKYGLRYAGYKLSKTMLFSITYMLAKEYAPGIRVNGIAPGLILPPEGKTAVYLKNERVRTLLKKHGDPLDIASAVLYLLTNQFITGQTLYIDGGEHLKELRDE